ncbi:alpha/beta fold hydrolase [Sphingosinicella sp. CPCC 101087]|uniref:alpha/beta fold hydrolase n=1 Tax=Sphingosinicella sp. CPCC 101087 TaxID=2497754 RepID=UPI0013ED3792|nr:alpha/beta hydrolase [Sphingosinicella sp. CPCC 101087]
MVNESFTDPAGTNLRRSHPAGAVFSDWHAPDDWVLRRMDWLQPAGVAPRGSLLFAGGRGDFIEKYLEIYAHWHRAGWNVMAFDWRGQGRSQAGEPMPAAFSFDPLVADLDALIRDWASDSPGPHVAVGHSMGGHLLLRTVVERLPPIDAAVLVAPMIRVNSSPLPESIAPSVADTMCLLGWRDRTVWKAPPGGLAAGSGRHRILTTCPERYSDELWWWEREPGFNLGGVTWGWLRAAYRSAAAFAPDRLGAVKLPILLIGTDRDRLVSAQAIREVAARLPGAELKMYPDAGHEVLREADRIRLDAVARIDGFLDAHAGAEPS